VVHKTGYNYRTNWAMNFKQNHLIPCSENFATKFICRCGNFEVLITMALKGHQKVIPLMGLLRTLICMFFRARNFLKSFCCNWFFFHEITVIFKHGWNCVLKWHDKLSYYVVGHEWMLNFNIQTFFTFLQMLLYPHN